jgi:hypothetical protein
LTEVYRAPEVRSIERRVPEGRYVKSRNTGMQIAMKSGPRAAEERSTESKKKTGLQIARRKASHIAPEADLQSEDRYAEHQKQVCRAEEDRVAKHLKRACRKSEDRSAEHKKTVLQSAKRQVSTAKRLVCIIAPEDKSAEKICLSSYNAGDENYREGAHRTISLRCWSEFGFSYFVHILVPITSGT